MKAVLNLEMPETCKECKLHSVQQGLSFCVGTSDRIKIWNQRQDFCPLVPLPGKDFTIYESDFAQAYEEGWNDALRAIEGDEGEENEE